jgi:glycogen(starch) synthase
MTFRAGMKIKQMTGKPLVLHVHTTEMDRGCGLGVNQRVYELEKEAFQKADMIFAVSDFTRNKIINHYEIDESKVKIIHNALESSAYEKMRSERCEKGNKVVLYFGRITMHKGPDYFIRAAKKVTDNYRDVTFVMAGTGDMLTRMMELSCQMEIGNKVLFTGYLSEEESKEIYKMADIYIMPSVSEPFGLTALEAMASGVPTIITKSCGVGEVVNNCFKVDFWDTDEMANKILSILKFPSLSRTMADNCLCDVKRNDWGQQAERCLDYYSHLVL